MPKILINDRKNFSKTIINKSHFIFIFISLIFLIEQAHAFHLKCFPKKKQRTTESTQEIAALADDQKEIIQSLAIQDPVYPYVLFWDNKNMGFGHIAIEIVDEDNPENPHMTLTYLSYAMGNFPYIDQAKHGKLPERIALPPIPREKYLEFKKWFEASPYYHFRADYQEAYRFSTHNCAHAVLYAMKKLGYSTHRRGKAFLKPVDIRNEAVRIQEKFQQTK